MLAYGSALANEPKSLPAPISTRHAGFSIPFRVEGGQSVKVPLEVQLHVSEDQGATWHLHSKVTPDVEKFAFRAPHDGEYWFMVRTRDGAGKIRPEGPAAPELRVLVDTTNPKLSIEAERGTGGELVARWKIEETNLKAESLTIAFQVPGDGDRWQKVAVERPQTSTSGQYQGEVRWWPETSSSTIVVKADVTDVVGNAASAQAQIDSTRQPAKPEVATVPPQAPIQVPTPATSAPAASTVVTPKPAPSGASVWEAQPSAGAPWSSQLTTPTAPPNMPEAFPNTAMRPVTTPEPAKVEPPLASKSPSEPLPLEVNTSPKTSTPAPLKPPVNSITDAKPEIMTPQPSATARSVQPPSESKTFSPAGTSDGLPAGVEPRMVNSRRFELEYNVDSVRPDQLGKVELWATRDGGRSWASLGVDDDNRSPLVATLGNDGVYGFRVVVETKTGIRGAGPKSGELPDIWVGIDTEGPQGTLAVRDFDRAMRPGQLTITWTAADTKLAARPIGLSFATTHGGPWTPIAEGLENTGHYDWQLDSRVPDSIYLRLEIQDEAGNVATIDAPEPVVLKSLRPQGRILNVRPVSE